MVIKVRVSHAKTAREVACVSLDVGNAVNFSQIASDRGGASASRHVRNFEGDERFVIDEALTGGGVA